MSNYEEFSCIDSSFQCYNENEDCEEANCGKHQKTSENQESDEDDTSELEQVTNQDARKFIAGLQLYFMQEGNENSPISALQTYDDFVQLQSENMAGYSRSIPPSLTVKKHMQVEYIN
jgi:uncharacterized membrane-anchored protein